MDQHPSEQHFMVILTYQNQMSFKEEQRLDYALLELVVMEVQNQNRFVEVFVAIDFGSFG
jgi:hypothetical protein